MPVSNVKANRRYSKSGFITAIEACTSGCRGLSLYYSHAVEQRPLLRYRYNL